MNYTGYLEDTMQREDMLVRSDAAQDREKRLPPSPSSPCLVLVLCCYGL